MVWHPKLHLRRCDSSLWPQRIRGGSERRPLAVSPSFHRQVPRETWTSTDTMLMLAWWKCTKQKTICDEVWQVSFLPLKIVLKRSLRVAEDKKIFYSQLVTSLVCLVEVHFRTTSTLQVYVTTIAWYRQSHVQAPTWLASCFMCRRKKQQAHVGHWRKDKIQERQSKRGLKDITYKYQAVPDHPATATQLPINRNGRSSVCTLKTD